MRSCYNCMYLDETNIKLAMDGTYTYKCKKNDRDWIAGYVNEDYELKGICCGFYVDKRYGEQMSIFNFGGKND